MNSPVAVFHFTQPSKKKIVKYFKRISSTGATICFDFEDILMDLGIHSYSEEERESLRLSIVETLEELFRMIDSPKTGIRLNNVSSINFEGDIKTLKHLSSSVFIKSVFLPKAENSDEICIAIEALSNMGISFGEIIPIVETNLGMDNINSLLSLRNKKINKIAFGHCDFNRDNNYFPFYHQNTDQYWQWIRQMLSCTGSHNKMIINSPYLFLHDDSGFKRMLRRMKAITPYTTGQITLSERQVRMCADFRESETSVEYCIKILQENKIKKAEEIISEFENNKIPDKSIAVSSEGILISPHEYNAAVEYIQNTARYEITK